MRIEDLLQSFRDAHRDCISLGEQLARLESTLQTVICKEKSEKRDKIIKKAKQEIVRINTSIGEALKGTQEILEEIYK